MTSTKVITPDQVVSAKAAALPDFVLESVNFLIIKHWDGEEAVIRQDEILDRLTDFYQMKRQEVFDSHWLDFEPIFEAAGWTVVYEKPGWNESGTAFFTFRRLGPNAEDTLGVSGSDEQATLPITQ